MDVSKRKIPTEHRGKRRARPTKKPEVYHLGSKREHKRSRRRVSRKGVIFGGSILLGLIAASLFFCAQYKMPEPVAEVDGVIITKSEFQMKVQKRSLLLARQARALGTTKAEFELFLKKNKTAIRQKVLSRMISRLLVIEAAKKEGMSVNGLAIEKKFQEQKAGLPSGMTAGERLRQIGETEGSIKAEIREQLLINLYMSQYSQMTDSVSPSEVWGLYRSIVSRLDAWQSTSTVYEKPDFEDVQKQLKSRLLEKKRILAVHDILATLQARSKVLVFADDLAYPPLQNATVGGREREKNDKMIHN